MTFGELRVGVALPDLRVRHCSVLAPPNSVADAEAPSHETRVAVAIEPVKPRVGRSASEGIALIIESTQKGPSGPTRPSLRRRPSRCAAGCVSHYTAPDAG